MIGNHSGARVVAVHQGKLVDVYGLHDIDGNRVIEQYRTDMLVGINIRDERSSSSNRGDHEILYDFLSPNPDTLQPRLLITREIGSEAFEAAVDALDDHVRLISPSQAGRNTTVSPYSVVPRNAALRVTFSKSLAITEDFFYDRDASGAIVGVKNTEALQLLRIVGDPNDSRHDGDFQQIDVRLAVRENYIIVDPVLLGTEGLVYGFRNSASGMPASPDQAGANIRLAIALDGALKIGGLSPDRHGGLKGRNNSAFPSIIRDFRSGNPKDNSPDLARGFIRDAEPPRLVGQMKMYLERVEPVNEQTRLITIFKSGIHHELDRGDLIRLQTRSSSTPVASLEILQDPADDLGKPHVDRVRVLVRPLVGPNGEDILEDLDPSNDPDFPIVAGEQRDNFVRKFAPIAVLIAEFTHRRKRPQTVNEYYGDDPRHFMSFNPTPLPDGDKIIVPNEFVSPFAGAIVRFSKPIDLDTVIALDTLFFATRDVLSPEAIDEFLDEREELWGFRPDAGRFNVEKFKTPHLISSNIFDANGSQTAIRVQPPMGLYLDETMRMAAKEDASKPFSERRFHYFLHMVSGLDGISDLAGNELDFQSERVDGQPVVDHIVMEFSVDTRIRPGSSKPWFEDNIVITVARRFADADEDEKPSIYIDAEATPAGQNTPAAGWRSEDFFGPISYLPSGELIARPATRVRVVVDNVNQIPPPPQTSNLRWCPITGPTAFASNIQIVNQTGNTPFGQPIQNPLNPFGCRLQTVWREVDMSLSRTDPLDFNLDVEQMYWAPFSENAIYFDEFDQISLFLGHCEYRPEVCISSGSAFPTFPNSGLKGLFSDNYLANRDTGGKLEHQPLMHPAFVNKVLTINARDAIFEPRLVNRFMPLPKFEDATKGTPLTDPYFVWRNELEKGQGGMNGVDSALVNPYPFVLSPFRGGKGDRVTGPPNNIQFDDGHWHSCINRSLSTGLNEYVTGGAVGTIALPLLADFWVHPDSARKPVADPFVATGINGWQISLSVTSAITPYFRAYSAGKGGEPVGPNHRTKWAIASGGFDLNGGATPGRDNSVYWIMADFMKRTAVVTSGFIDIRNPHRMQGDSVGDPRLGPFDTAGMLPNFSYDFEPPLSRLPAGTSIVTEFRGASALDTASPFWPRVNGNPVTAVNFPNDPLKAGDAHIRHFDDRILPATSASRRWWTYLYNRTVTSYTENPNDLTKTSFTNTFSGPSESFRAEDVRYFNWRFVMRNNVEANPPVSPRIESFAVTYRFQRR